MLKFLLITILIFYLIYKVGGFFFRMLFTSAFQQQQRHYQEARQNAHKNQNGYNQKQSAKNPPNSNVRVDYVPAQEERNDKKDFKGGQYVDYEEVK